MNKEEILYNQLYERTKEFGRTHFIKEIMRLERENEKLNHYKKLYQILKREKEDLRSWLEETILYLKVHGIRTTPDKVLEDVLSKLNESEEIKDEKV